MNKILPIFALALFACLLPMPYGYFMLVRFAAMIIFALMAYGYYKQEKEGIAIFFGAMAVLFQPLFKISLDRITWNVVDVAMAIFLFILWLKEKGYIKKGEPVMENVVGGKLNYLRMVRGANNAAYKKLQVRFDKLQQVLFLGTEEEQKQAKKFMYTFILAVMMIPSQVTALGFYDLVSDLGLLNNFIPLIVPSVAAPVTFFYMKQYMDSTLPLSIIESARIDGSGEFRTFNQIILPIMKPAIAVQAIFTFVSSWNNYFMPSLILNDENRVTLPIILARLRAMEWSNYDMGAIYICIAFAILPVIVVYLFLSKYIVGGVTAGSVKG